MNYWKSCKFIILNFIFNVLYNPASQEDMKINQILLNDAVRKSVQFKVGVVGGGIGGSAAAYFLKDLLDANVSITVFEADKVGGRLALSKTFEHEYETGGSIIHQKNKYMQTFIQRLGLQKRKAFDSKFGIFDGDEFVFHESESEIATLAKLIWRYGYDVFRLRSLVKEMIDNFSNIYDNQEKGISYRSVTDLLKSMNEDFVKLVQTPLTSHLQQKGFHDIFVKELVTACTRANYGQLPGIHAFVGSVSLAGSGSELWSVDGGNRRVAEGLLKLSGASLVNEKVTSVQRTEGGKFKIFSSGSNSLASDLKENVYDAVVVATPQSEDHDPIFFKGFPSTFQFPGQFESIYSTIIRGSLNATSFRFKELGVKVEEILTDNGDLPFNSVGLQKPVFSDQYTDDRKSTYKVFSPKPLNRGLLDYLFASHDHLEERKWLAYPNYSSGKELGDFELVPGLYYNNAIEWAASAMEMSVIAAKNSALLAYEHLKGRTAVQGEKDEL